MNFLKSLPKTFYSIPFYQDLVKNAKGIGLGFLLIATLLNLATFAINLAKPVSVFMEEKDAFFASLPALIIKDGALSIDVPPPVEVKVLEKLEGGPLKIIFDTTSTEDNLEALLKRMEDENIVAMAMKDKIVIYDTTNKKSEVTNVSEAGENSITREDWIEMGQAFGPKFLPFVSSVGAAFLFFSHLSTAFLGGVLILLVASIFKIGASFSASLRLAAAAKIPVAAVFLIAPPIPLFQLILWFGFAVFGLFAARKATP